MGNELIKGFHGKHLAPRRDDHFFHVFTAHAEAAPSNAGDDLIFRVILMVSNKAQLAKVLNAAHFILRCTIIFRDFRLNDDLGIEFARNGAPIAAR